MGVEDVANGPIENHPVQRPDYGGFARGGGANYYVDTLHQVQHCFLVCLKIAYDYFLQHGAHAFVEKSVVM